MSESLYYPYTTVRSIDALKAMILYFDKIHIISPFETAIGDVTPAQAEIINLEREGMIKFISPSKLLQEFDDMMTKSVIGDLMDPDFLSLSHQQQDPAPWTIYAEKVPSGLADAITRKYLVNIPNFYAGQSAAHSLKEGPLPLSERHRFYEERTEFSERRDRQYHEIRHVMLPFEVGESIMINHALCASYRFGLTPLTDNPMHHDFLMLKFKKLQNTPLLKRVLADYGFIKSIKNDLTAVNIISETIPTLTNASTSDLIEFRDANDTSLKKFRIEMGKLATEIEMTFWDADFYKKIVDSVDGIIKPAIEDLKASTDSAKEKLVRIFKKGVQISPLPIVASVAPGCIPEVALIASAGVIALDEYLESLKKKRIKRKNGFAYLFDAQSKFSEQI